MRIHETVRNCWGVHGLNHCFVPEKEPFEIKLFFKKFANFRYKKLENFH